MQLRLFDQGPNALEELWKRNAQPPADIED